MDFENIETTSHLESKNPELRKNYKNLGEFLTSYPPTYNLYYPDNSASNHGKFDTLLRILPDPASRIYSGVKNYELRKYVPRHTGLVFLLETNKTAEFTGCFYFESFLADILNELWKKVGEKATSKEKFDNYFKGKKYGVAFDIKDYEKFDEPIDLEDVYQVCKDMPRLPHPYVYLYTPVGSKLSAILRSKAKKIIERNHL